jgi:protoporphyrinogen oxidase
VNARVVVIGAGPAGLTASYLLSRRGASVTVLEADPVRVGGLSRTVDYRGFHFDIGGHRFFSKSKAVEDLWTELLPHDLLVRPRSSRILYRGKFYSYPLKALEAFWNLGPLESALCLASYLKAKAAPIENPVNFEDWVSNHFGERLYRIFFKTYTEKVWGMSCREISADWAAQRIKGLSLASALRHALLPRPKTADRTKVIKTLIDSFRYPRKGPGMMWDAAASKTREAGGRVLLGRRAVGLARDPAKGTWTVDAATPEGGRESFEAEHVISSAPIREVFAAIAPEPSAEGARAAAALRYRDFVTVALILKARDRFDDNWIYIHDESVKVGRIQNFKSWSPEMVPDPALACYGLEYFCFEGDGLWAAPDAELLVLATRELISLGLASPGDAVDGCVVRQSKAYPVYDDAYQANVSIVRREIEARYPGLHLVGRNGMHKYNNQDHAMMTAMITVENILAGRTVRDPWRVNQDALYHEAGAVGGDDEELGTRAVPTRVT